jgi:hypothetical protein
MEIEGVERVTNVKRQMILYGTAFSVQITMNVKNVCCKVCRLPCACKREKGEGSK